MGRKPKYEDDTARKAAKAERDKGRPRKGKSSKGGKRPTKARAGFFVAWDGEGRDTQEIVGTGEDTQRVKTGYANINGEIVRTYARKSFSLSTEPIKRHEMNVFAYSNADSSVSGLMSEDRRLTTDEILAFIGEGVKKAGSLAIHISFSFTYDVTHILYDMPREEVKNALSERRQKLSDYGRYGDYIIKYRPRKQLYIGKLRDTSQPYVATVARNGTTQWKLDLDWSCTIYDTFGFFQTNFVNSLKMWGVGGENDLLTIISGKEGRSDFLQWAQADIVTYNNLELQLLCNLLSRVRQSLAALDLYLSRWDGAGAIASALYKKELPKDYIKTLSLPAQVERACYHAFAGGRSECIQQGTYSGTIYRYDINSAYPDAMRTIPDLSSGIWEQTSDYTEIEDFALYHITWQQIDSSETFLPFFYRSYEGSIYFPAMGENWIWGVELKAAQAHCTSLRWEIKDGWCFIPYSDVRPFAFIERYYQERLAIKQRLKEGTANEEDNGKSLVIKLGLNSLFGKTIQKVGVSSNDDGTINYPPFYNIAIGSYITAYARSKLYRASSDGAGRDHIILFATDGILSTGSLNVHTATDLGAWEADTAEGLVMLQGGIYWLLQDGTWKEKSRGIDRATDDGEGHRNAVLNGWKTKQEKVTFTQRRFLGLKFSALTEERWQYRGCWTQEEKQLELYDPGEKRLDTPRNIRLDKRLYTSGINWPDHMLENGALPMSEPRALPEPDMLEEEREE